MRICFHSTDDGISIAENVFNFNIESMLFHTVCHKILTYGFNIRALPGAFFQKKMYQPSGNYDVLLGLGIPSGVSEALDKFLQEGFVEELSSSIIESFTKLNEENAMKCLQMMRDQCKDNNLSVSAIC